MRFEKQPKPVREPAQLAKPARLFRTEPHNAVGNFDLRSAVNRQQGFMKRLKQPQPSVLANPSSRANFQQGLQSMKQGYLNGGEQGAYQAIVQHLQTLQAAVAGQNPEDSEPEDQQQQDQQQ